LLTSPIAPSESVIKNDLEYVANYWTTDGYDLWEEVTGQHFFTEMVQYRALTEGAELATTLGDTGAATYYLKEAALIKTNLANFWSSDDGYLISTIGTSRDGLDCGTLLGALHGNGKRGFGVYQASSDEVLVTLQALVDAMTSLYTINSASGAPGVAIGRYPSDVYNVSPPSPRPFPPLMKTGSRHLLRKPLVHLHLHRRRSPLHGDQRVLLRGFPERNKSLAFLLPAIPILRNRRELC
jgi:GH15 family glucan-1,4-alpha-glucosidase